MKTACASNSRYPCLVQISRGNNTRTYAPTRASWKRFVRVALRDWHKKPYETFSILTSWGFKVKQ